MDLKKRKALKNEKMYTCALQGGGPSKHTRHLFSNVCSSFFNLQTSNNLICSILFLLLESPQLEKHYLFNALHVFVLSDTHTHTAVNVGGGQAPLKAQKACKALENKVFLAMGTGKARKALNKYCFF